MCWTATALPSICMFILPVSSPLFMDNWWTQIIIPLKSKTCFYDLQSFAMPCVRSRCLLIACLLSQRFCWANGENGQFHKVPSLFLGRPVSDIIVYSFKTHWSMSCLHLGWHTSHATKVKHKVHTFWRCPSDMYTGHCGSAYNPTASLNHGVILSDQCAFHCDETLTCYGFTFSVWNVSFANLNRVCVHKPSCTF